RSLAEDGTWVERRGLVERVRCSIRVHLDAADMDRAVEDALRVDVSSWPRPLELAVVWLLDASVEALLAAGRVQDAEVQARQLDDQPHPTATPIIDRMHGRFALQAGDHEEGRARLRAAADGFSSCGYVLEELRTRRALAHAYEAAGDRV